jgi:hypothetical protein
VSALVSLSLLFLFPIFCFTISILCFPISFEFNHVSDDLECGSYVGIKVLTLYIKYL